MSLIKLSLDNSRETVNTEEVVLHVILNEALHDKYDIYREYAISMIGKLRRDLLLDNTLNGYPSVFTLTHIAFRRESGRFIIDVLLKRTDTNKMYYLRDYIGYYTGPAQLAFRNWASTPLVREIMKLQPKRHL